MTCIAAAVAAAEDTAGVGCTGPTEAGGGVASRRTGVTCSLGPG